MLLHLLAQQSSQSSLQVAQFVFMVVASIISIGLALGGVVWGLAKLLLGKSKEEPTAATPLATKAELHEVSSKVDGLLGELKELKVLLTASAVQQNQIQQMQTEVARIRDNYYIASQEMTKGLLAVATTTQDTNKLLLSMVTKLTREKSNE